MLHVFVVNPYAGQKTFADDLRTKLSHIENLKYFVFNTRCAGDESELVRKIQHFFGEEKKIRYYCCGGSGTMRNMLNGFEDLSKVEVAFFPCGITNDFLKVFEDVEERFYQIEELIHGDVIEVDYIRTNYGVALNSVSTGMDREIIDRFEHYRVLDVVKEHMLYSLSTFLALFSSKAHEYEVYLDQDKWRGKFSEIFIGNGHVMVGDLYWANESIVDDGMAIYRLLPKKRRHDLLPTLIALKRKKVYKLFNEMSCGSCKKARIKRCSGASFAINLDGELIRDVKECELEVIQKGLRLVVPKGGEV